MLTIPWTTTGTGGEAPVVQVSRLELVRRRDVPGFLIAALRLRRATLRSPGALGVSLRAAPLRRTFWTLSAWEDRGDVAGFVRSDAHRAVMVRYRAAMADSRFETWTEPGPLADEPSWDEGLQRLDAAAT